ncbi:MAG: HAMP domain-containing sensor histidine kinase [Oscillospiraceae bacterium]|nr:HAMP domain-containing sensor histidine kinase [Oscillospiraceae bacterium]
MAKKNLRTKRKKSIVWRWASGNLLLTLTVLAVAEAVFLLFIHNTYYSTARQALSSRISAIDGQLTARSSVSAVERAAVVSRMAEEFSEKDKFELMLYSGQGQIVATSSGFIPEAETSPPDFTDALEGADGRGEFIGMLASGEEIMAISYRLPKPAGEVAVLRLVTSLTGINRQIATLGGASGCVILAVFLFSVFSGLYFVRSIVLPLNNVQATAEEIEKGNFTARLPARSKDEVGLLCESINHMAEELGKTEQMKNEFISSVSHELRTPLTAIKGWIETLQRVGDPADPNFHHGLRIVAAETDRLEGMVEELLDFSRMQTKGLSLQIERLDIGAEVGDIILMMEQRAQLEGIALCYEEPEKLLIVEGDRNRLRQVFVNLLDNAFKYSAPGGTVQVRVSEEENGCAVSVKDGGKGIAPDELDKVRQRFYKGRGAVRGSGIGLAVVQEILDAHGGSFTLQSEPGRGTMVTVRLNSTVTKTEDSDEEEISAGR